MESSQPRRVLVVDDNPGAAEIAAILLQGIGHEVESAQDGHRAVQLAQSFRPEVIFLDLRMPGFSGLDAAKAIRASGAEPAPTIVAVTGYVDDSVREEAMEAGFDAVIEKPMDVDELTASFSRYL